MVSSPYQSCACRLLQILTWPAQRCKEMWNCDIDLKTGWLTTAMAIPAHTRQIQTYQLLFGVNVWCRISEKWTTTNPWKQIKVIICPILSAQP
jgi:hypothetical protein